MSDGRVKHSSLVECVLFGMVGSLESRILGTNLHLISVNLLVWLVALRVEYPCSAKRDGYLYI